MTPVLQTAVGLAIPFVGTALGAAAVFLFKSNIPPRVQKKSARQVCLADFFMSGFVAAFARPGAVRHIWCDNALVRRRLHCSVYTTYRCVDMHAWFAAHIV